MTLRYLLDTNIISELLRSAPDQRLLDRFEARRFAVAIASVTWHELWFGCYHLPSSSKRRWIETYLNNMISGTIPILPYDEKAAEWHASERARLVRHGKTPQFPDGQIAAVAFTNNLILVTLNLRDYAAFENLEVQTWLENGSG